MIRCTLSQTEQILDHVGTQTSQQQHNVVSHLEFSESERKPVSSSPKVHNSHTCLQGMMCIYPWSMSGIQISKGNMNTVMVQSICTTPSVMCVNSAISTWSIMLADSIYISRNSTSCFVSAGAWLCSCFRKITLPQHQQADVTSFMT